MCVCMRVCIRVSVCVRAHARGEVSVLCRLYGLHLDVLDVGLVVVFVFPQLRQSNHKSRTPSFPCTATQLGIRIELGVALDYRDHCPRGRGDPRFAAPQHR